MNVRSASRLVSALVVVPVITLLVMAGITFATPVGPATVLVFTTNPAGAIAGVNFSTQPVVTIEDASGVTVASSDVVTLSIKSGTGTSGAVLTCSARAASNGVATFSGCYINLSGSGYVLTATATVGPAPGTALSGDSGSFAVSAPKLVFTTQPTTGTGGTALPTQPVVTIEDAANNVLNVAATVSMAITTSTGTSGAVLNCTSQAAVNGVATFTGCSIDKVGTSYTLSATGTLGTHAKVISAVSTGFDINIGPPVQLIFSQQPGSITAGAAFSPSVKLTIEDAGANPVTSGTGSTYTVLLQSYFGRTVAPLHCTDSTETAHTSAGGFPYFGVSAVAGVALFPSCTINTATPAGPQFTLIAEATNGAATPTTFGNISSGFTVSPAALSKVVFTTQPAGAGAGVTLTSQPVVALEDTFGNVRSSDSGGTASIAITSGTGASGATLACSSTTITHGIATFSGCSIDLASTTNYTLTATAESLSGVSSPFSITASGSASVAFVQIPVAPTGGSPFSVSVHVLDSVGHLVGGTVQLTLSGGPSGAVLTCPSGANPASAPTGTALFAGCTINKVGTYQLVATLNGTPSTITTNSTSFSVSAGPAASAIFSSSPTGGVGGDQFATQPAITISDLGSNTVTSSGVSVSLAIAPGTGAAGAVLTCGAQSGSPSALSVSGVVTFSNCSINKVGLGYVLQASAPGLFTQSAPFNVDLGTASALRFVSQPTAATAGNLFAKQPSVSVVDDGGNLVTTWSTAISLSSSSGDLTCASMSVLPTNGVAVFVGCRIPSTGTVSLTAQTSGVGSVTGSWFPVTTAAPLGKVPFAQPLEQSFGGDQLARNNTSTVDDVNSSTGALQFSLHDLYVAGVGVPLDVVRSYNSLDTASGLFGPGWSSIFDTSIAVASNGQSAVVRAPDGQRALFTSNGSGGWVSSPGVRATLVCVATTCTLRTFDGNVITFQGGRIVSDKSAHAFGLTFNYTGARLVSISVARSSGALTVSITENAGGEITAISTPTRTVSYDYGGSGANSNLTGFTDANAGHWTYGYASYLTSVVDPSSQTWLQVTYTGSQVTLARHAGPHGQFFDGYSYNAGSGVSTRFALITAASGHIAVAYQDYYVSGVLISQQTPDGSTTQFSYDGQQNLLEVQNATGQLQSYAYDAANNLIQKVSPVTGGGVSAVTYTYNVNHQLTSVTNQNGLTTTYLYSGPDLTSVTGPSTAAPTVLMTYNALGERLTDQNIRGRYLFSYDAAGNLTGWRVQSLTAVPVNGLGPLTTFNEAGQPLSVTTARGHGVGGLNPIYTTSYSYDGVGNLLTTTLGSGVLTSRNFDTAGNVIATAVDDPPTTSKTVDAFGGTVSTTSISSNVTNDQWNDTSATETVFKQLVKSTTSISALPQPSLTVVPTITSPGPFNSVGNKINFRYVVTNNGNVTLTEVHVTSIPSAPAGPFDALPCAVVTSCVTSLSLAPGQSATFSAKYTVTSSDLSQGSVATPGGASGLSPSGTIVSSPNWTLSTTTNSPAGTAAVQTGSLSTRSSVALVRTVTSIGPYSAVGATVGYRYLVTNTGNVALSNVSVSVSRTSPAGALSSGPTCLTRGSPLATCSGSTTTLSPGQTATFVATYALSSNDLSLGNVTDSATASGTPTSGPVADSVASTVTVNTPAPTALTTSTRTFDATGNLLSTTDAGGRITTNNFSDFNQLASTTTPDGVTTSFAYNAMGEHSSSSDTAGNTSTTTFNFNGQILTYTVDGKTTTNTYDRAGNLSTRTLANGSTTTNSYNLQGRLGSSSNGVGTSTFTYDGAGNLVAETEANGRLITFGYDAAAQLVATVANGAMTTYSYDVDGNLISRTDPMGRTTTYALTPQGQRLSAISVQMVGGSQVGPTVSVSQTFNSLGQRTTMIDGTGKHTYSYDGGGNLVAATDGAGQKFTYNFSAPGSMTENYPDGTPVTYTFDDAQNVMSVSAPTMSVAYLRNAQRQIVAAALSNGQFETNTFNANNQLATSSLSCAATTESLWTQTLNSLNQPIATTTAQGSVIETSSYGYNSQGRLSAESLASSTTGGTPTTPSTNCTSGVLSATNSSSTSPIDFYPLQNDGSGTTNTAVNVPSLAPNVSGPIGVSSSTPATSNARTYDGAGNVTSIATGSTSINGSDELVASTNPVVSNSNFDASGDLVSSTVSGLTTTYTYNAANQLARVSTPSTQVDYVYDGDGNLASRTVTVSSVASTTTYTWDPASTTPRLILERTGSSLLRRYYYGVGLVAFDQFSTAVPPFVSTFFVGTNPAGDVTSISNAQGQLVQSIDYSSFGIPSVTNAPSAPTSVSGSLTAPSPPQSAYSATVSWTAPNDNGGSPIASYIATVLPTGTTCAPGTAASLCGGGQCVTSTTSCTVGNLLNRTYVYSVVAVNQRGLTTTAVLPMTPLRYHSNFFDVFPDLYIFDGRAIDPLLGRFLQPSALLPSSTVVSSPYVAGANDPTRLALISPFPTTSASLLAVGPTVESSLSQLGILGTSSAPDSTNVIPPNSTLAVGPYASSQSEVVATSLSQLVAGSLNGGPPNDALIIGDYSIDSPSLPTGQAPTSAGVIGNVSVVSTGFNSVIATLERAGYSSIQLSDVLVSNFGRGQGATINELIHLHYDVDGVAEALATNFAQSPLQVGTTLKALGYLPTQIAHALLVAFP